MDPALTQALSLFLGTLSSAVLIYANYRWGGKRRKPDDDEENTKE